MKIVCPDCGKKFELEEYLKDSVLVQVIKLLPEFGMHGRLAWEYCELFGIGPPLKARKLHRLLSEVGPIFKSGEFDFQKKRYQISVTGLVQGLKTVCNGHLKGYLTTHNYLKKILVGIAEEEGQRRSKDEERKFREREGRIQKGDRVEGIADLPGKVRELVEKIG